MRPFVAVEAAKLAGFMSRALRRGGGFSLPGVVAVRLRPDIVADLAATLPKGVVVVTGTNGKTTTTKLLVEMLEAAGERVLTNRRGSNLLQGVASTLVLAADRRGRLRYDRAVFEVDEASLPVVVPLLDPMAVVVLNIFRDQLDRYGEMDALGRVIGKSLAGTRARVFLNADDPLVASLARHVADPASVTFFGLDVPATESHLVTASDSDRCPLCHHRLRFSRVYFGHMGHYACPTGDFVRPSPQVWVRSAEHSLDGSLLGFAAAGRIQTGRLNLPGLYNVYNAVASLAAAAGLGVEPETAVASLSGTRAAFGRVERLPTSDRTCCLLLIKNPTGFAQVLQTFLVGRRNLRVLVVINDLAADGRDVSWLWDVPLEAVAGQEHLWWTAGLRGADMQLRLKYAGIRAARPATKAAALVELLAAADPGEEVYVLATYTAMMEVRRLLGSATGTETLS